MEDISVALLIIVVGRNFLSNNQFTISHDTGFVSLFYVVMDIKIWFLTNLYIPHACYTSIFWIVMPKSNNTTWKW
jgi:hypothetical protein